MAESKMFEQQYAMTMLLIMTATNIFLGVLMASEIIPVGYGMSLSFFAMFGLVWKCKRDLMGNVRMWESPKDHQSRMKK
jgi:hypothetical protein